MKILLILNDLLTLATHRLIYVNVDVVSLWLAIRVLKKAGTGLCTGACAYGSHSFRQLLQRRLSDDTGALAR